MGRWCSAHFSNPPCLCLYVCVIKYWRLKSFTFYNSTFCTKTGELLNGSRRKCLFLLYMINVWAETVNTIMSVRSVRGLGLKAQCASYRQHTQTTVHWWSRFLWVRQSPVRKPRCGSEPMLQNHNARWWQLWPRLVHNLHVLQSSSEDGECQTEGMCRFCDMVW